MTKTRLLIVTDDANMGGTYRVAERLVGGLSESFDVQFACACNAKNAASRTAMTSAGTPIIDYQASERNLQRSAFAFRDAARLLDAADPDVLLLVEGAEIWSLLALKKIAELRAIPYVTAINLLSADCMTRFPELRARSVEALRAAAAIVFVSNASRLRFETVLPNIDRAKHVVTNSCPESFFAPAEADARAVTRKALGIGDDELVCLGAARVERRKGQILCLEALEKLRDRGQLSGVRLLFAGGGATGDADDLRRAIQQRGLSDNVLFLGPRDDVPRLLEACDVFVLASYAEGMPLSIIEAMARGRPVIATNVDGIPEQIDRASGILVPSPSEGEAACVESIADAMAFMRQNPRARLDMGRCARLRARHLFSEDRMIREYERILSGVAASAAPKTRISSHGSLFRRSTGRRLALGALLGGLEGSPGVGREPARAKERMANWRLGLTPGSVIDFSDPVQCWDYAGKGWSPAEPDGVWSDGAFSTLELGLRRRFKRSRLIFDLTPFVPTGHRQETDVLVNGVKADSWVFDAHVRETRIIDIRANDVGGGKSLNIQFIHRTAASPHAFGSSDDSRELAIFLHEIRIERIPLMESARASFAMFEPRLR